LKHNEAVHRQFTDLEKVYVSVRREVFYDIIIELGICMKIVLWLINMCPIGTCNRVRRGNYFSDMFVIRNGLKQGDALSPIIFNFAFEYVSRRVQVNHGSLQLNSTYQLFVYADDVNILGASVHSIKKNTEAW